MGRVIIVLSIVSLLALLGAMVFSGLHVLNIAQIEQTIDEQLPEPHLHFSLFLPPSRSLFFDEIRQGALDAAREKNIALSFHSVSQDTPNFRLSRFTGIDGAIIYPDLPSSEARTIIESLKNQGIHSVLIEHALSDDYPLPYVGTNNFDLGRSIGQILLESSKDPVSVAIVYSDKSPGIVAEKELLEMGMFSIMGSQLIGPVIRKHTDLNPLRAEELMYNILRNEPTLNAVVFTDGNDTLAASQVLIDLNMVGAVEVIGFGSQDPILDYLDKGILSGSILTNPRAIGREAVKLLEQLIVEGFSSSYIDTGVEILRGMK